MRITPHISSKPIDPLHRLVHSILTIIHPAKRVGYIHFLDSDDMLSLDCIERCVSKIGENEIV